MGTTVKMGLYRGYIGIIGYIVGLYRDNGEENGNYIRVAICCRTLS